MAELEGLLYADKIQRGTTRRWVLTDVTLCTSQRLKEFGLVFFKYIAKKTKENEDNKALPGRQGWCETLRAVVTRKGWCGTRCGRPLEK